MVATDGLASGEIATRISDAAELAAELALALETVSDQIELAAQLCAQLCSSTKEQQVVLDDVIAVTEASERDIRHKAVRAASPHQHGDWS